jgi:tight adherence protein B
MSRRVFVFLFTALAVAAMCLPAAAASSQARIAEAGGSSFPGRAYVLTLPHGMQLKAGAVRVFENGQRVSGVVVTPVSESSPEQFGVVLMIDSSTSMRGAPEESAFAAASTFATQRKSNQQLAVVTYNVTPSVVLPFTADPSRIEQALSTKPPLVYGTHIYDAVKRSLDLLAESHIKSGSIVLLSDGQEARAHNETTKHETEESVAAAARAAHTRIFTVGLSSRLSKLGNMKKLARDTGGRYSEARSLGDLARIYNELGSQLANEYLLHYRSLAGPNRHISVGVRVAGLSGVATTAYQTPKLSVAKRAPAAPYHPSLGRRIWSSPLTMVIVGLIAAILIGAGTAAVLSGPRKGTVRKRMAEFVSVPTVRRDSSRRPTAQLTEKMLEGTGSMLRGSSRWQKLKWELEISQIRMPAEQIIVLTVIGSLLAILFVKVLSGSLFVGIIIALVIPFAVRAYLRRELAKRRRMFAEQLPDNLNVLSSALRAGHSFIGALSVVVHDAPEPARSEFQRVVADEQLGVPIDEALHVVVVRMDSRELEQVALVAALQRETGGNTAEVLDRVTETIRERFELRRTVQTLTAQGRMSRWVLTFLPLFLLLTVSLVSPGYISVMYSSVAGRIVLVFAGISVTAGSLVIKRIVNIKV